MVLNYPALFFNYADGDEEDDGVGGDNDGDDEEDIGCNQLMNSNVESSCSRASSKTVLTVNTRGTCNTRLQGKTATF